MLLMRSLLLMSLIFAVSCSDKNLPKAPVAVAAPNPKTVTYPPVAVPTPAQKPPSPAEADLAPKVTEKDIDTYIEFLISETRNQLSNDSLTEDKRIKNVEFANRIFKVTFNYNKYHSRLSLVTHTAKAFDFQQTSSSKNIQYFNAYENRKDISYETHPAVVYTAQATILKQTKGKIVAILKIKDIETTAVVHVFYVQKTGSATSVFIPGYNYSSELTKTSKIFLQRLLENPAVQGEFYSLITEDPNISNASRFKLVISDNFTLESPPLIGYFREDQPNLIPLMIDYQSFWRLFFFGSTAYKVIRDSSYIIESPKNPIELSALNLELKVDGKEKIKGEKNNLPLKFHIQLN